MFISILLCVDVCCQEYSVISLTNGHNYVLDLNKLDSIGFSELYPDSSSSVFLDTTDSKSEIERLDREISILDDRISRLQMMMTSGNFLDYTLKEQTKCGVSCKAISTGEFLLNGVADSYGYFWVNESKPIKVESGDLFAIIYNNKDTKDVAVVCRYYKNNQQTKWEAYSNDVIVTVPNDADELVIGIQVNKRCSYSNVVVKPIVVSPYSTTYTLYGNNQSVSEIDQIEKVKDELSIIKTDIGGENMFVDSFVDQSKNGVTLSKTEEGKYVLNGTPSTYTTFYLNSTTATPVVANHKYAVLYRSETMPSLGIVCRFYNNGSAIDYRSFGGDATIVAPEDAQSLVIGILANKNVTYNNVIIQPKIVSAFSAEYVLSVIAQDKWKKDPIPMLTIIDDDGFKKFKKLLLPIIIDKRVPIASACVGSCVEDGEKGNTKFMNWADIIECQNSGAEILSHTYCNLSETISQSMDEFEIQYDYQKMLGMLRSHGINCKGLVFVGGSSLVPKCVSACKKVYEYGFKASSNKNNYVDDINRYGINRWSILPEYDDLVLKIDALAEEGTGWMVWMIHTSDVNFQQAQADALSRAIDYARSKGISIVTTECGVSYYLDGLE